LGYNYSIQLTVTANYKLSPPLVIGDLMKESCLPIQRPADI